MLDRIYDLAYTEDDDDPLGNAEYRLGLTYGGLAVRWLATTVDRDLLLGRSPKRLIQVGFNEGDWVGIGTLGPGGLAFDEQ